jgi:hypothetical protein
MTGHDSELDRKTARDFDFGRLVDAPANNTFMVKASYWFSI